MKPGTDKRASRADTTPAASRRGLLQGALGLGVLIATRPSRGATPPDLDDAIRAFAGGAKVSTGKVQLEVAPLVENGNAVPITVNVESPMTATEHVKSMRSSTSAIRSATSSSSRSVRAPAGRASPPASGWRPRRSSSPSRSSATARSGNTAST